VTTASRRLTRFLGVERNVTAASGAVFLVGLGEELWKKFLPKYLELLGASATAIGLFGTAEDFFDALYQYPGGWLADHLGRRRAFLTLLAAASTGYLIYLFSPSWPFLFLGLAFTMAWQSMASPAIFATIGDALPKERRAMGFTVQSMLKRIPMVISPLVGGAVIGAFGLRIGIKAGLAITLVFVGIAVPLLFLINLRIAPKDSIKLRGVWNAFHPTLKRLLVSDIAIRMCEGMSDIFTVLYVTNMTGITVPLYGVLVAVQLATAILVYIPSAKIADRLGRKPFVIATFVCFALFPVTVVLANSFAWLVGAFVIRGPARDRRTLTQSHDRRLRRGADSRSHSGPLLSCSESLDYTGVSDRRLAMEDSATNSFLRGGAHRNRWNAAFCGDC